MQTSDHPVTRRDFLAAGGIAAAIGVAMAKGAFAQTVGATVSKETEALNVRIVTEFCESFAKGDVAKATSLLAETCTYRGTQTAPPVTGREAVGERIRRMMTERGGIDFKVLKTVALGPIVVNQRDDLPREPRTIKDKTVTNFHVAGGVFFVHEGKIVEWTDYLFM